MEVNNDAFNEFKELFRQQSGKSAIVNGNEFLAYINAQQMIIVANRLSEISKTLKSIDDKLEKLVDKK